MGTGQIKAAGLFVVLVAASFTVGCGVVDVSAGEDYPEEEVELVVPYPAGSAPDSTARVLAGVAEEELGQSIVILNRDGGGGTVGLSEVVSAEPDGYTVGYASVAALAIQPQLRDTAYEGPADFQPVLQVNVVPSALFVNADSDVRSPEDFVEWVEENPGDVSTGIPNANSVFDFQADLLMDQANIELEKVAFEAGQNLLPLVNGTIEATFAQPAEGLQYVQRGDLRIVGILGEVVPEGIDAPLFADAGYDIEQQGYENVVAPEGTPQERVQAIHDAFRAAMRSSEYENYVRENYGLIEYTGPQQLEDKLAADAETYGRLIEQRN